MYNISSTLKIIDIKASKLQNKIINKGTGAGGKNTNIKGKAFEKKLIMKLDYC